MNTRTKLLLFLIGIFVIVVGLNGILLKANAGYPALGVSEGINQSGGTETAREDFREDDNNFSIQETTFPVVEYSWPETVIYNNGPLVNCAGCGADGTDESVLQNNSLGMSTLGFGHQLSANNRVADDFTIVGNGCNIDTVTFFAYQTGSSLNSTITAVNVQVWDGPPNDPNSNIIFGDTTTNRLVSTSWSNIYRVSETTHGAINRPIMANIVSLNGLSLSTGTYWLDWQADGTLASGPWAPPITINGQATTGNGLQSLAGIWGPILDGSALTQQGFPFIIEGSGGNCESSYLISGQITNDSGSPIAGVIVSTNSGNSTATDTNGNYAITGLTPGTYTFSSFKPGYSFIPSSRTVTVPPTSIGQNFTGNFISGLVWSDDFDTYSTGQSLHGINGWKGWENNPASTAFTSNVKTVTPPNSLDINGPSDLVHEYSNTSGQWTYIANVYIPSTLSGDTYFILLNEYDDPGTNLNWSVETSFKSASGLLVDSESGASLPFVTDQWAEIRVLIDLDADQHWFYYNGALLYTGVWNGYNSGAGTGSDAIAAVDLFANNATSVYYDDMSLEAGLIPPGGGGSTRPVVVLVHGWHGSPFHTSQTCNTGIVPYTNPYPTDFGMFPDQLEADGYNVYVAHLDSGPAGTPPIKTNATCLKHQLENISAPNGIILIAHSMGGLVSRAYIESNEYKQGNVHVVRLITLGTPHTGTTYGYGPCALHPFDYATCEFTPLGMLFFNSAYSKRAVGVDYYLIGGNITPVVPGIGLAGIALTIADGPNDGVVGVNSGMGFSYTPLPYLPPLIRAVIVNNGEGSSVSRYALRASHTVFNVHSWHPSFFNNTPGDNETWTEAYLCVRQLLSVPGGNCPTPQMAEIVSTSLITSTVSQLPTFSGHLLTGQITTHPLPIDTTGQSQFTLTWITGTLSLTLTDPFGTVIDPAYAASHPEEVVYYENLDLSSQLFATYAFTSTLPGNYTLNVTVENVSASGTDYSISTLVESPRAMTFGTDKTLYSVGDTAVISASVQNTGIGLTGATVIAQIFRPGVITDSVTLLDRGGGIYTGTYSIPNIAGYLGITVIANGNDNGIAYARQLNSLLAISSPTVQLNGQYSDSPQDDDNNDLYESLNLGIGLTSTQAGNYLVSGDLIGAGNVFIAHSVISVTLGTGTLTTTLPFNGDEIRSSGVDGAYTLTNLTIVDQQLAGVPAVWIMPNVWTTMPYDHTIFGTCKALTLITNPSDSGNIMTSPEPNCNNGTQFVTSTTITLTANAGSGYEFYNWTGGLNSVSNPISITLNSDLVITANFTVSLATITPTPTQTPLPTGTPTPSPTVNPSPSNTPTPTNSPTTTNTPTSTTTPSPSVTTTPTLTQQSPSATPSLTPTVTPTPIIVGNKVYLPIIIR